MVRGWVVDAFLEPDIIKGMQDAICRCVRTVGRPSEWDIVRTCTLRRERAREKCTLDVYGYRPSQAIAKIARPSREAINHTYIIPITKSNSALHPRGLVPDRSPCCCCNRKQIIRLMVSRASLQDRSKPQNRRHQTARQRHTGHSHPPGPRFHQILDPSLHAGPKPPRAPRYE